jgi:hypothetical protein
MGRLRRQVFDGITVLLSPNEQINAIGLITFRLSRRGLRSSYSEPLTSVAPSIPCMCGFYLGYVWVLVGSCSLVMVQMKLEAGNFLVSRSR